MNTRPSQATLDRMLEFAKQTGNDQAELIDEDTDLVCEAVTAGVVALSLAFTIWTVLTITIN